MDQSTALATVVTYQLKLVAYLGELAEAVTKIEVPFDVSVRADSNKEQKWEPPIDEVKEDIEG